MLLMRETFHAGADILLVGALAMGAAMLVLFTGTGSPNPADWSADARFLAAAVVAGAMAARGIWHWRC